VKDKPIVIFTFFERFTHPDGALLALGLSDDKAPVSETIVDQILRDDGTATGEVSWAECQIAFEAKFDALVECSRHTNCLVAGLRSLGRSVLGELLCFAMRQSSTSRTG
jgi:hypothetical protein